MFEAGEFPPGADLPAMYLSLPYNGGHVNQQYADIVGATAWYTDDAIFFSYLLHKDIQEYGNGVAATFRTSLKQTPPEFPRRISSRLRKAGCSRRMTNTRLGLQPSRSYQRQSAAGGNVLPNPLLNLSISMTVSARHQQLFS